jgi:hypothetical protein
MPIKLAEPTMPCIRFSRKCFFNHLKKCDGEIPQNISSNERETDFSKVPLSLPSLPPSLSPSLPLSLQDEKKNWLLAGKCKLGAKEIFKWRRQQQQQQLVGKIEKAPLGITYFD